MFKENVGIYQAARRFATRKLAPATQKYILPAVGVLSVSSVAMWYFYAHRKQRSLPMQSLTGNINMPVVCAAEKRTSKGVSIIVTLFVFVNGNIMHSYVGLYGTAAAAKFATTPLFCISFTQSQNQIHLFTFQYND